MVSQSVFGVKKLGSNLRLPIYFLFLICKTRKTVLLHNVCGGAQVTQRLFAWGGLVHHLAQWWLFTVPNSPLGCHHTAWSPCSQQGLTCTRDIQVLTKCMIDKECTGWVGQLDREEQWWSLGGRTSFLTGLSSNKSVNSMKSFSKTHRKFLQYLLEKNQGHKRITKDSFNTSLEVKHLEKQHFDLGTPLKLSLSYMLFWRNALRNQKHSNCCSECQKMWKVKGGKNKGGWNKSWVLLSTEFDNCT